MAELFDNDGPPRPSWFGKDRETKDEPLNVRCPDCKYIFNSTFSNTTCPECGVSALMAPLMAHAKSADIRSAPPHLHAEGTMLPLKSSPPAETYDECTTDADSVAAQKKIIEQVTTERDQLREQCDDIST